MAPNRIDVHHHFVPDFYREAVVAAGGDPSGWFIPEWTPELDQAVNDRFGITTTMLSLTAPGACIVKDAAASAALARKTNEYAAQLRDAQPHKYGFFAALPSLLDKERALAELAHALDVLGADGVTLFTRYGEDNHYLGHPDFADVWAELDRRAAVVFVHPTHPVDTAQVGGLPQPVIRYPMETTTAALDLLHSKTVRRHPRCKIILSHAGGTLPFLVSRPASILTKTEEELAAFWDDARSFYYDTAVAGADNVMTLMETFAKPGHLLYGSDTPYANDDIIRFHTSRQDKFAFRDPALHAQINRENALALFPRLRQYS